MPIVDYQQLRISRSKNINVIFNRSYFESLVAIDKILMCTISVDRDHSHYIIYLLIENSYIKINIIDRDRSQSQNSVKRQF